MCWSILGVEETARPRRGVPAAQAVCEQIKTQVTCWQPTGTCDAEASVEQTGSCCRVFPVPAILRQTGATFRFNKAEVERIWAKQSSRHANSPLTQPVVYRMASPADILGDQRLLTFLDFSGSFILLLWSICLGIWVRHTTDIPSLFQHASKCQLLPQCINTKTSGIMRNVFLYSYLDSWSY